MVRILLIEDDATIRSMLETIFSAHGFACGLAADGFEALDLLGRERFDVILLDLMMPRLDGGGFLEEVERRGLEVPPIVVCTAVSPRLVARIPQERIAAMISKPFHVQELVSLVRSVAQGTPMQAAQAV